MIKNEKELQTWFKNYLNDNGIYARKLETPFARGWSDIYTLHNGIVTWIELKWLRQFIGYSTSGVKELATPLQKKFLNEQIVNGGRGYVLAGYYPNEKVRRGEEPKFFLLEFPTELVSLWTSPQLLLNALWPQENT